MKKFIVILISAICLLPVKSNAEENLLQNAKSGILVEQSTGEILYEKNKDEQVSIASLTKMVVQIIALENIENGNLKWDEIVTASSNAAGMGGTQIWLTAGEKMSVEDLFKGMSMASANDATVALAERIAGTESAFVKLMNEKVKELGLKNTVFKNCTGLDEEGHFSSAYDLAVIARELLKHDEILKYSSVYEDYIRKDTPNKYWLVNTNKLVRFYEGADGLKTGFTDAAGYTMAVTAKRDDLRLIAIVLGENDSKVRNQETTDLLDYGFNTYKIDLIKKKGEVVDKIKLDKASVDEINIVTKEDITILNKKSAASINYDTKITLNDIKLPLQQGSKVGKIDVIYNGKIIKSSDLVVEESVKKVNFFKYIYENLKDIVNCTYFN